MADLIGIMGEVASLLWGEPNRSLSSKTELRFGRNGSRAVRLDKGTWYDNEQQEGGGVLALVRREVAGIDSDKAAADWIRSKGIELERPSGSSSPSRPSSRSAPASRPRDDGPAPDDPRFADDPGHAPEPRQGGGGDRSPKGRLVTTYDYRDESGELLFQVCRFELDEIDPKTGRPKKTFRQRRPDGRGGWSWSVKGTRLVPYRLPELIEAIGDGKRVFIVEGEKDVENLASLGFAATCNPAGAGKWIADFASFFTEADVVILRDNDEPGFKHGTLVASTLFGIARRIRIVDLPDLPEKGDVSDWIEADGDPANLESLIGALGVDYEPGEDFESRFGAVPWSKLDAPGREHEWLVKGWLTEGERSMVAGPSQSGKSFFVLDLALAVARNARDPSVSWFGNRIKGGGVVYQAGEGGLGLKKRVRAWRKHYGVTGADDVPFVLLTKPVDLYGSDDHMLGIIQECEHWRRRFGSLAMVIFDTFSAMTPGANENASEDMSRVLARMAQIADALGCHIMVVHHMNAAGAKPRGHSSIFANLDNVILVEQDPDRHVGELDDNGVAKLDGRGFPIRRTIRTAKVAKQKDGESGEKLEFVLKAYEVGQDSHGDPITSCAIVPVDEATGAARRESKPGEGLRLSPQCLNFLRAVATAIGDHGVPAPASLGLPSWMRAVEWKHVRDVFARIAFEIDPEDDVEVQRSALKKAISRHGEKLLSERVIGRLTVDGVPFVWITGDRKVKGFGGVEAETSPANNVVPFARNREPERDLLGDPFDGVTF